MITSKYIFIIINALTLLALKKVLFKQINLNKTKKMN